MSDKPNDNPRRTFLYTMAGVMGTAGACATAVPFIHALEPAADTVAAGVTEFDVSTVEPGMMKTIMWRGQPVFVVHRTEEMLKSLYGHDDMLRDPLSEAIPEVQADWMKTKEQRITRAIKPEYLVVSGVCTHLGCIPMFEPNESGGGDLPKNWPGGWHCACHGSNYDLSGRVFKGVPAPYNLFIPPYRYTDDTTIRIG